MPCTAIAELFAAWAARGFSVAEAAIVLGVASSCSPRSARATGLPTTPILNYFTFSQTVPN